MENSRSYKIYFIALGIFYFLLVISGIHSSSLEILGGDRISGSASIYGIPQPIRSDEYLRSTPILLGQIKSEELSPSLLKRTLTTPFDANYADELLSGDFKNTSTSGSQLQGLYSKILNIDDYLLSFLPLQNEFVARWWLNSFFLFIGLGLLFKSLKMSWKYSLFGGLLVWLSPPNQWWSLWPMQSLGPAALAAGLFLSSIINSDRRINENQESKFFLVTKVLVPLLSSAFFAIRLPGTYQPWSIPTVVFFASMTIGAMLYLQISFTTLRKIIAPFLAFSVICAIPLIVKLAHSVSGLMSTVYPGSRRFSGFIDYPHWAGPVSWGFQNVSGTLVNQSEFAIGILLFIPVAMLTLVLGSKGKVFKQSLMAPISFGCVPLAVLLLWIIAPWSEAASELLLLSRFPPDRIMQLIGVLAPIVFVLSIGFWREKTQTRDTETRSALIIFGVVFVLTLQGSVSLKLRLLGNLSLWSIWLTALVAATSISSVYIEKFRRIGMTLIVLASVFSVVNVNPIVRGTGIFGKSAAMETLKSAQELSQGRWASDNYSFDSIPTGGGMRLLSGNQGSGPNLTAYRLLDPSEKYIDVWNRGGSYVFFNWTTGVEISFVNPGLDIVAIQIDPCNQVLEQFDLSWVVSSTDLSNHSCLNYFENIVFQGTKFNVYRRS
jgi:hypothetical protein